MSRRAAFGMALAVLAVAAWALNFVVARWLIGDVPSFWLAFLRWLVAGVVLALFAAPAAARAMPLLRRHWRLLALTSLTGMALFNGAVYLGAQTSEATNLALIAATSPVFTLLFSRFVGDPAGGWQWLGAVVAVVGVAVIVGRGDPLLWRTTKFVVGDLWMLCGAALWAAYTMLLRRKPAALGMTAFHAGCVWISLPFLAAFALAQASPAEIAWSWRVVAAVAYLGLVASILCYYCWNGAIVRVGVVRAGAVYYALPLFAAFEAALLLGEEIFAYHWLAMALIIGGVVLSARRAGGSGAAI